MKNSMIKMTAIAALTFGFAVSAHAKPPQDKGKNKSNIQQSSPAYQPVGGTYQGQPQYGYQGQANCPPGLAKKGCIPPGQAKKYQIGQPLPNDMYRWFEYSKYGLQRPEDGYYYSRHNRDVVLVHAATRNVVELVTILEEIF